MLATDVLSFSPNRLSVGMSKQQSNKKRAVCLVLHVPSSLVQQVSCVALTAAEWTRYRQDV